MQSAPFGTLFDNAVERRTEAASVTALQPRFQGRMVFPRDMTYDEVAEVYEMVMEAAQTEGVIDMARIAVSLATQREGMYYVPTGASIFGAVFDAMCGGEAPIRHVPIRDFEGLVVARCDPIALPGTMLFHLANPPACIIRNERDELMRVWARELVL